MEIFYDIFKESEKNKLIFDSNGNVIDWNNNFTQLVDVSSFIKSITNIIDIFVGYKSFEQLLQYLLSKNTVTITFKGNKGLLIGKANLVKNKNLYLLCICEYNQLQKSKDELFVPFNDLIETFPDPIFIYDTDDYIVYVNQAFANFHGLTTSDIIGKHISEIYPPDVTDTFISNNNKVKQTSEININKSHVLNCKGEEITSQAILRPIRDNTLSVIGVIGTARNINNHQILLTLKQTESNLFETGKINQIMETAKSVGHNLNNILQNIEGFTDIFELNDITHSNSDFIAKMHSSINQASDLTKTLFLIEANELVKKFPTKANLDIYNNFEKEFYEQNGALIFQHAILIIDDNAETLEILKLFLTNFGFKNVYASNSSIEGIELYKSHSENVGAVILNYILPELNGLDVYSILKSINEKVKIVFISGHLTCLNYIQDLENVNTLPKPFNLLELIKILNSVLNKN